ncbi:MAG: hypothetical protein GY737_08235, partial [Desulfobacteraceae bacterium]|nr:hypothetical protein [Desulfobacteraceae bacterium]
PDGLEDIPPYIPTPEEEVMAALIAEGVNNQALTSAHYLDRMGYPDQAEAMDEAITRVAGDFPHYPSPEANLPERMAAILALI